MLKTALVFSYDLLLDFLYWKNFTFETRTYKLQVYIFQCMNFLLFFFLFFCWDLFSDASFFFDTVSLVTWCGRGNVGYYSETDRVVEHREMGLRQVEIAFSLILANFLNDFFKEEQQNAGKFLNRSSDSMPKRWTKRSKKVRVHKNMSLGSYRNNH